MKKNILIAAYPLNVGGTTSALISLLNNFNYDKYSVDLLLLRLEGEFLSHVPKSVNILPPALKEKNKFFSKMHKFFIYLIKGIFLKKIIYIYVKKNPFPQGIYQIMCGYGWSSVSRKLNKYYDVAIGFSEGWPNNYISKYVKAQKKIAWIHPDYKSSGLDPVLDLDILSKFDNIVLVSDECKKSFDDVFYDLSEKSVVIENLFCADLIKDLSECSISDFNLDKDFINIITASRLRNSDKGIDRAVLAMHRLKLDGYKVKWYILGEGEDYDKILKLINKYQVADRLHLLGIRENPYPYMKKADLYVQPSRYEGKPLAVTEAQILGVPVIATNYNSAIEQINSGFDGIIIENTDDSVYYILKKILTNPKVIKTLKNNLKQKKFYNHSIESLYDIIEKDKVASSPLSQYMPFLM